MDGTKVPPRSARALAGLLDSPEIVRLIAELEETRWTGRPGYPLRAMVGVALTDRKITLSPPPAPPPA